MITLDTETCGLHGPVVLLQYTIDDGPIILYDVWKEPIDETLELIQSIASQDIVGFNLAFDWFHLCQLYTTLKLLALKVGYDKRPEDYITEYALCEPDARDGDCLKPKSACDLMLVARKGPYQSTMDRKDVRVRRVPMALAGLLCKELDKRIKLKDFYFARSKTNTRWHVEPIKTIEGGFDPDFVNITLKFKPSSALKVLATDALGLEPEKTLLYKDVEISKSLRPVEIGWAPFALATGKPDNWKGTWPHVIKHHISHWAYYQPARDYAAKDVVYTRALYYFFGSPAFGDDDSVLACMVGAVRWRGFSIDVPGIRELRRLAVTKSESYPKAPRKVRDYISEVMSDVERAVLAESTKRVVLENISKWVGHPAAARAQECLDARKSAKEVELYDKLLTAGRFHASFRVIGTKSSRMSGADGLNPQGIKHDKFVREKFNLAHGSLVLCGGDFAGFEVSIADAVYNDPELRKQLTMCASCKGQLSPDDYRADVCPHCGQKEEPCQKIHGLFGQSLNPGLTYDDIVATKGSADDLYDQGKRGIFSQLYGGNYQTMVNKLGVTEEVARAAESDFARRFKGVGAARERIFDLFCSMRQPGGLGGKVEWHDPSDYIESLNGFRRFFTLENTICKALYGLASKIPPAWRNLNIQVKRRDRNQKVGGAVMSALFGAAFQIQAAAMRAAANHEIQCTGSIYCKMLQARLWTLQPAGVNPWIIQPMNVHDEIMAPMQESMIPVANDMVSKFVNEIKTTIPLIKIDWSNKMENWASK